MYWISCCPQTEQTFLTMSAAYKRFTSLWFPAVTDAIIGVLTCIQDTAEGDTSVIDLEYCDEFLIAGWGGGFG